MIELQAHAHPRAQGSVYLWREGGRKISLVYGKKEEKREKQAIGGVSDCCSFRTGLVRERLLV